LKEFSVLSEQELIQLENKIGTSVSKTKSYYDARIKLRETKEILIKTKHRFERAQALHVAAKELAAVSVGIN
jgi:DNA-binding transcriptional regulator YhcF (GntR family)